MTISQPTYCTRQDVKRSLDIKETARQNWMIDQAIQSASRNIDKHLHRVFYPMDTTHYWDWPLGRTSSGRTRGGSGSTSTS